MVRKAFLTILDHFGDIFLKTPCLLPFPNFRISFRMNFYGLLIKYCPKLIWDENTKYLENGQKIIAHGIMTIHSFPPTRFTKFWQEKSKHESEMDSKFQKDYWLPRGADKFSCQNLLKNQNIQTFAIFNLQIKSMTDDVCIMHHQNSLRETTQGTFFLKTCWQIENGQKWLWTETCSEIHMFISGPIRSIAIDTFHCILFQLFRLK